MESLKKDKVWDTLDAMDNKEGKNNPSYTTDDGTHDDAYEQLKQWEAEEAAKMEKNPGPVTDDSKPWLDGA